MSVSIGERLESFYLALLTLQSSYHDDVLIRLADALYDLENHIPDETQCESKELLSDVLKDVRKKSSQAIRTPYVETINQLIISSRKRLKAKAALVENEVHFQHGQRYVHILLELLGSWSNIIVHVMSFGFSKEILQLTLSPLHQRVIEMSKECFQAMKIDKDLDNWCMKLMQSSFPPLNSSDGLTKQDNYQINLATLDNFGIQLSSMRNIINQHYLFLFHTFLPFFQDLHGIEDMNMNDPQSAASQQVTSYSFFEQLVIVTKEELLQWKEIDMMYITLETSYLQQSIIEACLEMSLISLEEHIYIFQLLEDSNFLFHKILERSYQTNEEKCMFMIGNKILELVQFQLVPSVSSGVSNTNTEPEPGLALFATILQNKRLFFYCSREQRIIYTRTMKKLLSRYTGRDYLHGDDEELEQQFSPSSVPQPPLSNEGKNGQAYQTPLKASQSANQLTTTVSSLVESNSSLKHAASYFFSTGGEEGETNNQSTAPVSSNHSSQSNFPIWNEVVNNASLAGVNQWIGWASPLLQGESKSAPPSSNGTTTGNANSDTAKDSPTKKLPSTMEELLLHALDLNEESTNNNPQQKSKTSLLRTESTEEGISYSTSAYYYDYQHLPFFSQLIEADYVIYLNCLSVMIKILLSLRVYLTEQGLSILSVDQIIKQSTVTAANIQDSNSNPSKSSIWVLIQEYSKCEQRYEEYLLSEIQQYIHQKYQILERKQREEWMAQQQSEEESDFSLLLEASSSTITSNPNTSASSKSYRNTRNCLSLKFYLERKLEITGQEMEEIMAIDFLRKYYLLMIQQYPFSPFYFHLPEDKSASMTQQATGFFNSNQLPSFLMNPLSFFQETPTEPTDNKAGSDKTSTTREQDSVQKSYLSEAHYVMILSEIVIYLLRCLIRQVLWGEEVPAGSNSTRTKKPKINEWGALLVHEEIISLRKYYEGCIFQYQPTSATDFSEADSSGVVVETTKEFRCLNDRNYFYIAKAKQFFQKILNIMLVLTLDAPQDIKRYSHLISSTPEKESSTYMINDSLTIPSYELFLQRKDGEFTNVEIQYLLSRRTEFLGKSVTF